MNDKLSLPIEKAQKQHMRTSKTGKMFSAGKGVEKFDIKDFITNYLTSKAETKQAKLDISTKKRDDGVTDIVISSSQPIHGDYADMIKRMLSKRGVRASVRTTTSVDKGDNKQTLTYRGEEIQVKDGKFYPQVAGFSEYNTLNEAKSAVVDFLEEMKELARENNDD